MSQDKELEIQMQFLEEATDYLNTLEGVLLEIDSHNRIESEKMNAALRAAHSIKGGAGMMGFRDLSDLAHRLEDCFKVLKTQKNSLDVDTQLQSLLLSGVDRLRQIISRHSEGKVVDHDWLATTCYPVFEELHTRLGDPTPEDASTILSPEEDGQDIIPLLFESEVEGSLQRLESILADAEQPSLGEEISTMAAELGGLAEMLQLDAFSQLCQSVTNHLETANPSDVPLIAQAALAAWRRSQALVLTNQFDQLPTEIDLTEVTSQPATTKPTQTLPQQAVPGEVELPQKIVSEEVELPQQPVPEEVELPQQPVPEEVEPPATTPKVEPQWFQPAATAKEIWLEDDLSNADFAALQAAFADETPAQEEVEDLSKAVAKDVSQTDYKFIERNTEPVTLSNKSETQENTVRVPSKQLEAINDLFGELIIQRNGLNLQLEKLRKLVGNLTQRVQILERENLQLRQAYDQIATPSGKPSTPAPATEPDSDLDKFIFPVEEGTEDTSSEFDALEMDRYNELNLLSVEVMETIVQVQEVTTDLQLSLDDTDKFARKLNKSSKQLQTKLTNIRMRPLSDLVDRFPRALRDLSVEYGKNVQLAVEGGNTLIERSILEALSDPLMHLLRNAFDHGIEDPATRKANGKPEQGLIQIKANHRSNRIIISLQDDGRGISLDKIRARAVAMGLDVALIDDATDEELLSLIFEPGFTTSEQVTELSGRGVGMDVVRNNLKQIRGDIKVDTKPGKGTTFILSVPFTLSVARVLLVETNRMLLALPTDVVEEIFLLQNEMATPMGDSEVLHWQSSTLPLVRLGNYFEFNCPRHDSPNLEMSPAINAATILIINSTNQPVAVAVDRCWGEQEVAIRHVEGNIPLPPGFSSCTILGDGRVVPLVNANEMLYWIANHERTPRSNQLPSARLKTAFLNPSNQKPVAAPKQQKGTILIVDDSINVRRFLALTLEKGGYRVEQAKDGQDALEKLQTGLQVQAVICDIEMPRVDGYGFLGRIKTKGELKNIPVAMLTSRSSEKHRQLAMKLGAVAYFSKPYNEQELLRTLEDIIVDLN
ncbi:MAG: response regulator [Nostocaceae cyanobacterium]|nr:response regulator [Nostocaceae cyanobacterium]